MVPPAIGNLEKLEVLILSDQVVRALPTTINNCTQLRELDLRNNLLFSLPDSLVTLDKLQSWI